MNSEIYQVSTIGNGVLSVMAKPIAGEWIHEEFSAIKRYGIDKIVSLLEFQEANQLGLANEKSIAESHHIEFLSYPIPDRGLPHSIKEFLFFTKELHTEIVNGLHLVIHCRAGIGRTGMVAAGILLHQAYTPAQAFDQISLARRVKVPDTEEQMNFVSTAHTLLLSLPRHQA